MVCDPLRVTYHIDITSVLEDAVHSLTDPGESFQLVVNVSDLTCLALEAVN